MKINPIIAVKNVEESSTWYQEVFACTSMHGGNEFDTLKSKNNEIFLCLHKWEAHGHPTMKNANITPGNGLILYIRTENIEEVRDNLKKIGHPVESEIQINPNSGKRECSFRDPDGYYLTIAESHEFEG